MQWTVRAILLGSTLLAGQVSAQPQPEGFLCCNMRSDGSWISDINYAQRGKTIIPVGTPVKVTGYGRHRVYLLVAGGKQALGNDYSRDLEMDAFVTRYVVKKDPRLQIATFPAKVREAINSAKLTTGMTREQVTMSVGMPVGSENPKLDANIWRFWREGDPSSRSFSTKAAGSARSPPIRRRAVWSCCPDRSGMEFQGLRRSSAGPGENSDRGLEPLGSGNTIPSFADHALRSSRDTSSALLFTPSLWKQCAM